LVGTVAANTLAWGAGGINIESSRVGTGDNLGGGAYAKNPTPRAGKDIWSGNRKADTQVFKRGGAGDFQPPSGRWPNNVLLSHLPDCQMVGTVARWECSPGCPIPALDAQSGISVSSGGNVSGHNAFGLLREWDGEVEGQSVTHYGDKGGASRYFKQVKPCE